jgi:Na+-driven multidrug efflux pump
MLRGDGYSRLERKYFKFDKRIVGEIFAIGLPMGLSKCTFSLANIIIYSSLNVLGDLVMAANSIAKEFDGFILETLHGISVACLAVVSQNLGAKRPDRIKRTVYISLTLVTVLGVVLGAVIYFVGTDLCGIMTDTEAVIEYCMVRIVLVSVPYTICGIINVIQETIRGLGYSNTSLVISICANIVYRLVWIWAIYPALMIEGDTAYNYGLICLVWPTSWLFATVFALPCLIYLFKKVKNKLSLNITEKESLNVAN